ncbi:glycoside hydrolase family 88/105 protein [Saccharicrinis aurantiacus]|uniref:glycoside hydrolase family 88/105 protein n=1 Tax=Saccharicrinis aurantiacus TaxID=1849719 RepID=UPI0024918016|nr:glycoside hydrolase family 88 protein [Saccharicrinis aurantiacus]
MKKLYVLTMLFSIMACLSAQDISPDNIKKDMKRVADWQIEHFGDTFSGKNGPHHPLHWTNGALYVGMVKWADMADDNSYWEWMKKISEENEYKLYNRMYHADDHTVGQMYIELYRKYGDEKMIEPTKEQLTYINYHPAQTSLVWKGNKFYKHDRWSWCDALFMAPPVWAKLYNITGDEMYRDFLMREFKATTDYLFDKKENLYFRDQGYMGKLDNGTKIFWSRGNGWVFAGLANIMDEFDPSSSEYKYFLKIYKKMAKKLISIQTEEGHWAMSLLGDKFYPTPETSGSAFYVFGLAWGINNGILDKETYEPSVIKGWNSLVSHITADGMLGYVQPIGAAPGNAWADKTEVYGAGAFLSAGAEMYQLVSDKK